jgi:hypothetical protein
MAKLKNILSEIEWKGMNVELGKVYTFKDIPPFKTPQQIKEEEEATKPKLDEASEIPFDKLTPIHQKQVQAFSKVLRGKPIVIFEGIHGMIVDIKVSNPLGVYRFDSDELKKLLALKIRWVEADKDTITIGF